MICLSVRVAAWILPKPPDKAACSRSHGRIPHSGLITPLLS